MSELLRQFVARVGDGYYLGILIGPNDNEFSEFDTTTWLELERDFYLEPKHTMGNPQYRLTPHGWLKGLELSGAFETEALRLRAITLARALKALVKGRDSHFGAIADERDLAGPTALPAGWIYNALSANLLNAVFPNDDMTIERDPRVRAFRVPQTFGMDWREPL